MIQEEGIVLSVGETFTKVQAEEKSACSSCSAHHICGEGTGGKRVVESINTIGAKPGQRVKIELKSSSLVIGSTVVFLIPLIFLFVGVFSGYFIGKKTGDMQTGERMGAICGGAALILSFFIVKYLSARLDQKNTFYPEIKEIIE